MQISQISSNLFYPLNANNLNNKEHKSEGTFASLLELKLNNQDAATMFGIGGISGSSEINLMQLYSETISNAVSSIMNSLDDEEENSNELLSQNQQGNNFAVADIIALREKARELFA